MLYYVFEGDDDLIFGIFSLKLFFQESCTNRHHGLHHFPILQMKRSFGQCIDLPHPLVDIGGLCLLIHLARPMMQKKGSSGDYAI